MTPLQQSIPPLKSGLGYHAWMAKQALTTSAEIQAWLEKITGERERKKGKRAA